MSIEKTESLSRIDNFFSLTPFLLFIGLFICSVLFFDMQLSPLFSCLIALTYSLTTFPRSIPFNTRIQIALQGSAHPTVIAMCYIFIFSAVLTYILTIIGGLDSAIRIGMYIMPSRLVLPGFFTVVSFFALAIGSSMGSIAAFLPIGLGIAQTVGFDPALIAGIVVSGAMLGDNLSIISDTTIAATQTTQCSMTDKFKENSKYVMCAFTLTLITLTVINMRMELLPHSISTTAVSLQDLVNITPYGLVFLGALTGLDVIAVLIIGILSGSVIGVAQGSLSLKRATGIILEGFAKDNGGIQEVLILVLLVAALSHVIEYNGGINYLLHRLSTRIKSPASAEWHIVLLVFLINAAVAINTIAILITGPVAKKIGDTFFIPRARVASLIDIVASICQGILPYAPQLLLAGSLAGISSMAIIPYLHYQGFMAIIVSLSIAHTYVVGSRLNLKNS